MWLMFGIPGLTHRHLILAVLLAGMLLVAVTVALIVKKGSHHL